MEFLGGNRPTRIPESDIARIKGTVAEGVEKPKPKVLFELGETVRVKEGAFADFNGRVDEVNYDVEPSGGSRRSIIENRQTALRRSSLHQHGH